ncbi:uncharacterized protein LOC123988077 [Osmia bicornis bicornis]|uniref:uncharacterized protein LOC123988077 n=1 Tax=Osmia bicornis bicornis TaxID=1437191 RepID=UPI001EAEC181|nr:uncharacterized protein LOC123988077 [Osmia bicornis bicornis]
MTGKSTIVDDRVGENASVEYLLERIKKLEEERVASELTIGNRSVHYLVEAIPSFSGDELGESADSWCDTVENITKDLTTSQRLCCATHSLAGSAKEWYRTWKGNPRNWTTFREDLCSVYAADDRIGQLLRRAVLYTSDDATSYAEYARTKLKYLQQTKISFKVVELVRLIIADVTDATTRQSLTNARYANTAELIAGMAPYVKQRKEKKEEDHRRNPSRSLPVPSRPGKRCFVCNGSNHIQNDCPKRRRITMANPQPPSGRPSTCSYCAKRGHDESNCWIKQRAQRYNTNQTTTDHSNKGASKSEKRRPEVNACYSLPHHLTPIILRDLVVQKCLIDSGATCSLVKEDIAKRANCKIELTVVTVKGIGDVELAAIGITTTVVQTENVTLEMDLLVVSDSDIPYDVIIGRNVLAQGGLQIVTKEDGTSQLLRCPPKVLRGSTEAIQPFAYIFSDPSGPVEQRLAGLMKQFEDMIVSDGVSRQKVTTGELTPN